MPTPARLLPSLLFCLSPCHAGSLQSCCWPRCDPPQGISSFLASCHIFIINRKNAFRAHLRRLRLTSQGMNARSAGRMHLATSEQQPQSALRAGKHSRADAARYQTQPSVFHRPGRFRFSARAQRNEPDMHCQWRRWANYFNIYADVFLDKREVTGNWKTGAKIEVGD